MTSDQILLEKMAQCAYCVVEQGLWSSASPQAKANYRALVREWIDDLKLEQQQPPAQTGQKEIA